jgi:hypothetical protein
MADESNRGPRERMCRAESASEAEVEWFLTCAKGQVPEEGEVEPVLREAAKEIRGWLDGLPTFHAGALELRFTPREWSPALEDEFGVWTSPGMSVRTAPVRTKSDLEAKPGSVSGSAKLVAKAAGHRASYEWQYSTDQKRRGRTRRPRFRRRRTSSRSRR